MSDPLWQFWTNWIVQASVAVGTGGAVYAALFGESFKARWVRLSVSIENPRGVYTPTRETVQHTNAAGVTLSGGYNVGEARYYQVRVGNKSKRFAAHHVDVWLTRVDQYRDDSTVETWTGEIPMTWQHQGYITGPRTIGSPANVDLVAITVSLAHHPVLELQPQIPALNLPRTHEKRCKLRLGIEVRSDEAVLEDVGVWVEWDGKWSAEDDDMEGHVRFELDEPT